MMSNLDLYNRVREVPKAAQKEIRGGRLNGKTDINPMWRIQKLTEEFGPVGAGWYTQIKRFWTEEGAKGERSAFCEIELYVKIGGEWSKPIAGIGGSAFVAAERSGADCIPLTSATRWHIPTRSRSRVRRLGLARISIGPMGASTTGLRSPLRRTKPRRRPCAPTAVSRLSRSTGEAG